MLGKLMKYESKAMGRILLPLYIGLLVISGINRIFLEFLSGSTVGSRISAITTVIYIFMIIAVSIATFILIIIRFYKNFLGDEGYLMFTLPVKTSANLNAKMLVSSLWSILSVIVVIVSLVILLMTSNGWNNITDGISFLSSQFWLEFSTSNGILIIIEFVIFMLTGVVFGPLLIYASAAIGQLIMKNHKVLGGFVGYLIISTAAQIISLLFMFLPSMNIDNLSNTAAVHLVLLMGIVMVAIMNVVLYFITHFVLSRKLNLE
ncbi:hypothetical protein [Anaerolentibacter hominis]|uniref:hypothetical protein n=1 Tax=Anaerolentibacter hominis TaxID=3079009 RepID=UPI0031B82AF6